MKFISCAVILLIAGCLWLSLGHSRTIAEDLTPERRKELEKKAYDLTTEGLGQYKRGNLVKALEAFREALDMNRVLYPRKDFPNGHTELAQSIGNLCVLYRAFGENTKAEPLYREALEMYRALYPKKDFPNGHTELAGSINNLGVFYLKAGQYSRAEVLFREALEMCRALYPRKDFPSGHPDITECINNLGALYLYAGEYSKAEALFSEALAFRRALYPKKDFPNGHLDLALSLNNLGLLYQKTGQYTKAVEVYHEALAIRRALYPKKEFPNGHSALATTIDNLAGLYYVAGEYSKAEPLFREALDMKPVLFPRKDFPKGHTLLASSLNNLGLLYQSTGEYTQAAGLYREALDMNRTLFPGLDFPNGHPELAISLDSLGSLSHVAGDYTKAESLFREAVAMRDQLLRQFANLAAEAESRNFASTQSLARDALLSVSQRCDNPAQAYDSLWDGRAILTRLEERRHRDILASANPETTQLAGQLRRARDSLAPLLLNPGRDPERRRLQIQKLTSEKEDLEKRIAAKLPLTPDRSASAVTTPRQLSQALPGDSVFVDIIRYVFFDRDPNVSGMKGEKRTDHYVAFVVRKDKVERIELKAAAAIDNAWATWHDAIVERKPNERALAAQFASLGWEPIRQALPADVQTVYLTADGKLAQVPWAALPGRKPDSVLLENHALCLVPHGPWLLERQQNKTPSAFAHDRLLVYGGVAFDEEPATLIQGDGVRAPLFGQKSVQWPSLPATAREQQQIAALASKTLKSVPIVRSGKSASTAQLLQDLTKARYAHLATHGFFANAQYRSYVQADPKLFEQRAFGERRSAAARSPLILSGLVLAGANRQGAQAAADLGIVTAESLIGLPLEGLELAVLSACDTGLGESGGGEGVYGLQRAFHIAGCHNVIASLWKVDDDATQALMTLFYRNLWDKKLDAAEALRQAQLTLYRNSGVVALARTRSFDFTERDLPKVAPASPEKTQHSPVRQWAAFTYSGVKPVK
jgi:CHAT domain-containing protein